MSTQTDPKTAKSEPAHTSNQLARQPANQPAKWRRRTRLELLNDLSGWSSRHALVHSRTRLWLPMQIRLIRESRGWTQAELATASGMSAPAISRIESTRLALLRLDTLLALGKTLDLALIVEFVSFAEFRQRVTSSDRLPTLARVPVDGRTEAASELAKSARKLADQAASQPRVHQPLWGSWKPPAGMRG